MPVSRDKKPFNRSPNCGTRAVIPTDKAGKRVSRRCLTQNSRDYQYRAFCLPGICGHFITSYKTLNVYREMQLAFANIAPAHASARTVREIKHPWRIRIGEWTAAARPYTRATLRALARGTYKPNLESHLHALSLSVCIRARIMWSPFAWRAAPPLYAFGFHSCEMAITWLDCNCRTLSIYAKRGDETRPEERERERERYGGGIRKGRWWCRRAEGKPFNLQ
jgi:hypothetical protein